MEKTISRHAKIGCAVVVGMIISYGQLARGGWTGAMNGVGYGWATVNVVSYTRNTNIVTTPTVQNPSGAMTTTAGYEYGGPLPAGSSVYTKARTIGTAGYIWQALAQAYPGDGADDPELESQVNIVPADCAAITLNTTSVLSSAKSGTIIADLTGTAGTAIWLRGFEYHGQGTPGNIDDLKTNGAVKWNILLVGPFDLTKSNCNAIIIPFTVETDITNLYFVANGVAKSNPLIITCPGDVAFGCSDALVYPAVQASGGCGNITVSYDPPANSLPSGVPTLVTATVTDQGGNITNCTFTATRQSLNFDGFFPPINGTGGTCQVPLRTINKGSIIPVKFQVTCNDLPYSQGTPTLTISKYSAPQQGCAVLSTNLTGLFQYSASTWHINWDTSGPDFPKGTYLLTANLQDGSKKEVFVKLK